MIAADTSFDLSDYGKENTGSDIFKLWIKATTMGLNTFVLGVKVYIGVLD